MSGLLGSGSAPTNSPIEYSGLNVGTSQWNMPVPIFWGTRRLTTNAMAFANFQGHAVSGKGGGKGGDKSAQQQTYTADVLLGLCEGPVDSIQNIWSNGSTTTTTTLLNLNMTFFSGTLGQAAWSIWSINYPTLQQGYSQTAYLGAVGLALGQSATIPENDFECIRAMGFSYTRSSTVAGWINPTYHTQANAVDVLLSDVITDFLTNVQYGQFMASGDLGPITQYAAYCRAQGLFVSPLLNSQEKVTDILNRWAQVTNSWIFWSGVQLEFVPLADAAITGNGVTFTPANDVAYTLTLDDLITGGPTEPPVKVTRKDPADCYNRTSVNICDRTLGYIDNPIQWFDDQLIDQFGLRDNTSVSANEICDPIVGAIVAQLVGKRAAYIRNTYSFKTNWNFILCLPGTVLMIPLNYTGQSVRVRVTDVSEDDKGIFSFTAEEFPGTVGTYVAPQSAAAVTTTLFPNLFAAPPSVNTPAIFEPPASFTGGVAKVIIAASGGANWGGCNVSISFDGTTYVPVGTITAPAPQGVLTASLAAYTAANPDTTDTLAVDLTQSLTTPKPVTNADATYLRTLALVAPQPVISGPASIVPTNGELLAFGNTAITGTYTANLTYLERGQYGTSPLAHASGEQFTLIDVLGTTGTTVSFNLPAQYIGQVAWLKFASFNVFGVETQSASAVVEYQYGIVGAATTPSFTCFVFGEVPSGAINGSNTAFTLAQMPVAPTSVALFYNGQKLTGGADYTVSGTAVTLTRAPTAGDVITANYVTPISTAVATGGPNYADVVYGEVPGGAINGSNTAFTLTQAPYNGTALMLVYNGQVLTRGTDYTITGAAITLTRAPASGDVLRAYYIAATTTIFSNLGPTFTSFNEGIVPAGAINSANTTFTLAAVPHSGLVMVVWNGLIQTLGTDYTITGAVITMARAPATGDTITTSYVT